MTESIQQIAWRLSGYPKPQGKTGTTYRWEAVDGSCACCAGEIGGQGVPVAGKGGIDNPTYSQHADYLRWGTHVCSACAWWHGDPKRMHRGALITSAGVIWPSVSGADRVAWDDVLAPVEGVFSGVLTSDPKPRLWPRMRPATGDRPGLVVHDPRFEVSGWLEFDWARLGEARALVKEGLRLGLARAGMWGGLVGAKASRKLSMQEIGRMEVALAPLRGTAELVIALMITRAKEATADATADLTGGGDGQG